MHGGNVPVITYPDFVLSEYTGQWLHSQTRLARSTREAVIAHYVEQSVPAVVLQYNPTTRRHQVRYHFDPRSSTMVQKVHICMCVCMFVYIYIYIYIYIYL